MAENVSIKNIQFKRGDKANLEAKLVDGILGVPKEGEPIFERDTGKLKIGNGVTDYLHLPYLAGEGGGGSDDRFIIVDPLDGQVLLYDESLNKWVNKDLADENSIIYLANHGLTLKGYDQATQGQMLVKDAQDGLAWVTPLDTTALNNAVATAQEAAGRAGDYASAAGTSASNADTAKQMAEVINQRTLDYVNNKFWWGTLTEYNNLSKIDDGTFYFITAEE